MRHWRARLALAPAALLALALTGGGAQAQENLVYEGTPLTVPEEYVVQEGDTLWAICGYFFRTPYVWPAVWALNPHVTNPHWIYPGDVVRLRRPDRGPTGRAPGRRQFAPSSVYLVSPEQATQGVVNLGYIGGDKEPKPLGKILASPAANVWLDGNSLLYIQFDDLSEVQLGQRYTVYRRAGEVKHPESGDVLGNKMRVLGVVEIVRVDEKVATGRLKQTYSEVERGALVGPLEEHYRYVSPQQNLIDLDGFIIDQVRSMSLLGQFQLLFIDRGSEDGVQVGNRFTVVRREDGSTKLEEDTLKLLPWEDIAELLVVDTRSGSSTVLVTRAERDIQVGDKVKMRRNY